MTILKSVAARPMWVSIVATFGAAWNIFGIIQLIDFAERTRAALMMGGMTPAAADLYYGLPGWMQLVFALGSIGGLVGSFALLVGSRWAVPVLVASLLGYVALWFGDLAHGVFEIIPGQMAIVTIVVAIAVALLATALLDRRHGRPAAGSGNDVADGHGAARV